MALPYVLPFVIGGTTFYPREIISVPADDRVVVVEPEVRHADIGVDIRQAVVPADSTGATV